MRQPTTAKRLAQLAFGLVLVVATGPALARDQSPEEELGTATANNFVDLCCTRVRDGLCLETDSQCCFAAMNRCQRDVCSRFEKGSAKQTECANRCEQAGAICDSVSEGSPHPAQDDGGPGSGFEDPSGGIFDRPEIVTVPGTSPIKTPSRPEPPETGTTPAPQGTYRSHGTVGERPPTHRARVPDERPAGGAHAAGSAGAQTMVFMNPEIDGKGLDWCLQWGAQCGEPAASAWCRSRGYGRAGLFQQAPDVGNTWVMGARKACKEKFCDGFRSIQCINEAPPSRVPVR